MGQIANLISADTDKFAMLMPYLCLVISSPLWLVVCFLLLFYFVRWAFVSGILVMLVTTVISGVVQNKARQIQAQAMKAKDARLKLEVRMPISENRVSCEISGAFGDSLGCSQPLFQ